MRSVGLFLLTLILMVKTADIVRHTPRTLSSNPLFCSYN